MILCGRSPRHLYVANRLCASARALAIVQETAPSSARKILAKLRPANLAARRGAGCAIAGATSRREARFFFGDEAPRLARQDCRCSSPHQ